MKLLIIQLSDMHFENTIQTHSIHIDKMMTAIKSVAIADECIVVVSGDMACKGKKTDYNYVKGFIAALHRSLTENGYRKKIHVLTVPGNHDINFSSLNVGIDDIIKAYENKTVEELNKIYIDNMKDYFAYAAELGYFVEDKVVSKKVVEYGGKKIAFVLCNTAPLSLLGGNAEDMGNHYLSDLELEKLEEAANADINILVMHHSIEWLRTTCKDKLRKIITKKYSLVLSGHEQLQVTPGPGATKSHDK